MKAPAHQPNAGHAPLPNPNNIGHIDSPGCFRCHDDNQKAKDGKKISQDCETCHTIE